ncbi:DUF262 domain-containing HNH endonuclease family protein [Nostoc sp. ChiSLP03a]|uniref:DUF262 domain-containing protein n=1 Tax=Nostoc sp. ChiSLP03a TaxID=3075380 RepID=UPI002AD1FC21|nr:DUF262 domain-containing HNH endonuclease family protein [Nostoc sp. ChiSLP03a]MDZ8214376.1 DUF262 domain-containing HNH endonuclease family protein [Nostoc sp. ChiSLP03a]
MNQQTIKSLDLTIDKLFDDFYSIPPYQREYVWEEKQVEQLLYDVYKEFPPLEFRHKSDDYFIGSIVVCPSSDGTNNLYEVIDGQQRITTAHIFSCVVKNYLVKLENHAAVDSIKTQIYGIDTDSNGFDVPLYKVALQYEDSSKVLDKFADDNFDLEQIVDNTKSAQNLVNAYGIVYNFISNEFGQNESELRRFYLHFTKKVKLVRVETADVNHALRVFETLNDRGVGLNPMDLLKNLMFKQANIENFENINTQWKELNDAIQSANEKPFSFLRYFIFSNFDVKRDDVQEEKVYEWFLNNNLVCQYTEKPIEFVEKLRKSANAYASFIKGKNTDGTNNRYLANIKHLTPNSRQHMSLLLTGLELPKELFIELCRQLENTLFALIITGKKLNELERTFIEWSSEIRKVKNADTLHQFVNQYILPIKKDLRQKFEEIFLSLQEKDLPKYRLKYMLAKFSQYINEKAFGSEENWINLNTFIQNKIEIEHILPQKPEQAIVDDFDKPNEITKYISRLGNLTLLEKTINASIGRGTYSEKKAAYSQSVFLLTRSITEKPILGNNTAINRAVQDLKEFTIWNSQAIEERQKMLTYLAKQVWDMDQAV